MISRLSYDVTRAERPDRQSLPETYRSARQEVILDPWENDDCPRAVGVTFSQGPIALNSWTRVTANGAAIWQGKEGKRMVRILEDPVEGLIYYRRPVDIERQMMWNQDHSFRISAREWWDNEEMNQWYRKLYPGIYWFRILKGSSEMRHPIGSKFIIEAHDQSDADTQFAKIIAEGHIQISFEEELHGPYQSQEIAISA